MLQLVAENVRTYLLGSPAGWVDWLSHRLRYPTNQLLLDDQGNPLPPVPGEWDGWVRLVHQPTTKPPWVPTGLLPHVCWYAQQTGVAYQVMDQRVKPELDIPEVQVQIPLWPHQQEGSGALIRHGRGVIDMPPRGGKTRTLCAVQRNMSPRTLWIAPTDRIVRQTHRVIEGFFGPGYAYHQVGGQVPEHVARARVIVCTNATASMLQDEVLATRQAWIVDEVHHGASDQVRRLGERLPHVYYRWGATGTFFRSGLDELAMHALLSNVVYRVTAGELLRLGYLVPVRAAILPLPVPRLRMAARSTFHGGGHGTEGVHEHDVRNRVVSGVCAMLAARGRSVVCLVGTRRQGKILRDLVRQQLPHPASPEDQQVEFVHGQVEDQQVGQALDRFEQGRVRVLLGTTILGEGVDLPRADALVLARGEHAEVALTQAIYRVCTAYPGKSLSLLVDFEDDHHPRLREHALARQAKYAQEELFQTDRLSQLDHFPLWLDSLGVRDPRRPLGVPAL
ncbi:MAG: helicase-related protein [Lentisphaeria bacterium]